MIPNAPSKTGRYVTLPRGGLGFIPKPLPPDPPFEVDHELWSLLSQADRAIGRLDGATEIIPNPDLFIAMYVRKEAVLSSQIEGTQASLTDVLEYEATKPQVSVVPDVGEVVNYVAAMNFGLSQASDQPVSVALVKELHARLLVGTRGGERTPGEFRHDQNWVGAQGASVAEASYVPPPPEEIEPAMRSLEDFIRRPSPLPPLIRIGLIHAQFETIHPFADGNGRIGRLLVALLLCREGILRRPLFYPSLYLKKHRQEYYDRLQATRSPGEWEDWLKFFLRCVSAAAEEAATTARKVVLLREQHRARLQSGLRHRTATGLAVLDQLYRNPVIDVNRAAEFAGKSYANTNRLIADLLRIGLLAEITGFRRNRRFIYRAYVDLFEERVENATRQA